MSKYFDILAYLMGKLAGGGGGGDITVESKSISANGTYTAPAGKAYSPVSVSVPNSYAVGDEGKVVSNGALVAQGSDTVTQNGTVDTTLLNSLEVNVSGGGGALVYEKGEKVVAASQSGGLTFEFANYHSEPPVFFCIARDCTNETFGNYPLGEMALVGGNFLEALGVGSIETKASSPYHVVGVIADYRKLASSLSAYGITATTDAATRWSAYATAEAVLIPPGLTVGQGVYKWVAVWKSWD